MRRGVPALPFVRTALVNGGIDPALHKGLLAARGRMAMAAAAVARAISFIIEQPAEADIGESVVVRSFPPHRLSREAGLPRSAFLLARREPHRHRRNRGGSTGEREFVAREKAS